MNPGARPLPSRQLVELLCKALLDEELREKLFTQPDQLAREFCLASEESQAIKLLDRERLGQLAADLR